MVCKYFKCGAHSRGTELIMAETQLLKSDSVL